MKSVVILTGSALRHSFLRRLMAMHDQINVLRTYCEGLEKDISAVVEQNPDASNLRESHLEAREASERDFFELFLRTTEDNSNPEYVTKGAINSEQVIADITEMNPDIIVAYGCSIIRGPLLHRFRNRILNLHLGLSPYYRGSGTNYWPLVNWEPQFVGATFMYLDEGVDTGEVIHQIRARFVQGDTPAQVGNRLIVDAGYVYREIVANMDNLQPRKQIPTDSDGKYYRKKDFTSDSVGKVYENFATGMIQQYNDNKEEWNRVSPIVQQPASVLLSK